MKQRKILMVLMGLEIGGAETHVVGLSAALQKMGWQVVIASAGGVYEQDLVRLGIRHYHVPTDRRSISAMKEAYRLLEDIIRQEHPDIVHAHARIPAFLCGRLQKKLGFPFVTTAHWTFTVNPLLRRMTDWGQKTIAVSEDIRDYLIDQYNLPAGDIHVTVNGIDTQTFSPEVSGEEVRREFHIPDSAPVVVCVTRMHSSRALSALQLAELAPELARRVPDVRILLVGDGDCLPEIRNRAEEVNSTLGYPCLLIAGARVDIPQIIRAGDVFVGVSRAALEAMSCGVPTILCGNEGYAGILQAASAERYRATNYCCRDYPMSTTEALTEDVAAVLAMTADAHMRAGLMGREIVLRDFSLYTMARDCQNVYDQVLSDRKTVVVSGYYGYGNLGDDAILQRICDKYGADCDLVVLSRHPVETEKRYHVTAIDRFSPVKVRRALKHCDALLSGGGSLLQDRTSSRSLWYYLWVIRQAQHFGKRVLVYANGVGPIRGALNRKMTAKTLSRVDAITVRDSESEKELRRMGIANDEILSTTADPVFELDAPEVTVGRDCLLSEGINPERGLLGVALRSMNTEELNRMADYLNRVCTARGLTPVFFCMQRDTDVRISELVLQKLNTPGHILSGNYSVDQTIGILGCMELVVGMRLHTLILSAVAGTPVLGFSLDPKVEALMSQLDMPLLPAPSELKPAEAEEITITALQNRAALAKTLQDRVKTQRESAAGNDDAFRRLILREGVRKRVCFFQTNLHVGGIQKALVNSVSLPALKDCDIELYLFNRDIFFDISTLPENVTIHYLRPFPAVFKVLPFRTVDRLVRPFPITGWYDAAVDFDSYQHDCAHGALGVRADRRIMWIHNDMEIKLREEPKYRILFRFMKSKYRRYTHFAAVSQGIVEPFRNCSKMPYANVSVVPNLINTDEIHEKSGLEPELRVDASCFNVVSVGRLCHQKGYDLMLADMKRLLEKRPELMCYLVGDGPDRDALKKQVERLGLKDHVCFTGNLANPYPMMRQMDAFCLESRYEGQGIVFWEAKSLGLPLYFPRRLEKYNPSLTGCDDVVAALAEAKKLNPAEAEQRFDPLTEYNSRIEAELCSLLGLIRKPE